VHALATALINWSALGKIVVAAVIGGIGVVLAFGLLLLALSRAQSATSSGQRLGYFALSTLCGLICLTVVGVGIYAMVEKPVSKKPAPAKSGYVTGATAAPTARRGVTRQARSQVDRELAGDPALL
jgi:hypothetical protein